MTKILAIKLFSAVTLLAGLGTTGAALSGGFSKALKVSPMTLRMTETKSGNASTVTRAGISSMTFIGSGAKTEEDKTATSLAEIKTLAGNVTPERQYAECKVTRELAYFVVHKKLLNNQPLKLQCKGWGNVAAQKTASTSSTTQQGSTPSSK